MELQFEKKSCRFLRCNLREVKQQEQTQELRLPDGMPDIGTVVGVWGQCVMRGKEWNSDSIATSGGVMVWVLYTPAEGGAPRTLEAWLPVQLKWNMSATQRTGSICCDWWLKAVDGRILSARKLLIRANVCVCAEAMEPWEEEITVAGQVPEDVQLLKNTYPVRLNVEAGEKTFTLDEDVSLPAGAPEPEKLLYCIVMPRVTEQKVLGGKAIFRGEGDVRLMYQSSDGQLYSHDQQLSFSQFADLDRDYSQEAEAVTAMAVSALEPELADGRIRIKCGLVAQYIINDRTMLELAEDAYSPVRTVNMDAQQLQLPAVLDRHSEKVGISCTLAQTEGQPVDVSMTMEPPVLQRAGELTQVLCNGQVQVLYYDETGALQGNCGRWSREWELLACPELDMVAVVTGMEKPQISVSADQMEVTGQLQLELTSVARQPFTMLTKLELGEPVRPDPGRPSLILRRMGSDSLWRVAKQTGSTVAAIRAANGITDEPEQGKLLLIPVS